MTLIACATTSCSSRATAAHDEAGEPRPAVDAAEEDKRAEDRTGMRPGVLVGAQQRPDEGDEPAGGPRAPGRVGAGREEREENRELR